MRTFKDIALSESIMILSDEKMDIALKGKKILTFGYNEDAIMDFAKTTNVYVTKDKKFFHITNPTNDSIVLKSIEKKTKKYDLLLKEAERSR